MTTTTNILHGNLFFQMRLLPKTLRPLGSRFFGEMLDRRPIYIELKFVKLDPLRHFQCLPAKWAVLNWDMGVTEGWNSRADAFAYCESMCGTAECEELDVKNDWQCERNSFHG